MTIDLEDYSLARVIKGIYDSEYKTIATDDEGNIVGVFKGIYGTTLHTIKVDSQGRMLAIITDPEDVYGNVHQFGNAELSARLGCPSTIDRRGNILWMDDFEGVSAKWESDFSTGGSAGLNAEYSYSGSQSYKLVTDNNDTDYSKIYKEFPHPVTASLGCEFMARMPTSKYYLSLYLYAWDGSIYYTASFDYQLDANEIRIMDDPVTRSTLADSGLALRTYELWMYFKLVVDWTNKKYVRLIAGNKEFDLSSYPIPNAPNYDDPKLRVMIYTHTAENASKTTYIDDFILTQNEL